jgi:hypothetical protein
MKRLIVPLATAACMLLPSTEAAFATDLHTFTHAPGQTGSNVFASCGPTTIPGSLGNGAKSNAGVGSPFSSATKTYAGNPGNPPGNGGPIATLVKNPVAVSQYDNACAQAAIRQMP